MTNENLDRLREMQHQIERAAGTATTRAELMNLRSLWGSLQVVINNETAHTVTSDES